MIEMPQLRLGQRSFKFSRLGSGTLNGEPRSICTGQHGQPGFIVDNSKRGSPYPRLRTCIPQISGDGKLSVSAGQIGNGLDVNALHKSLCCNEQLHRPVDASVMRPITGTSPGHHVLIECIVNAHCDGVGLSPTEQMRDIKHERGVALAYMLSSQFPVYPDCGRMEYGLKLDPYGRVLPLARRIESAPIPGDTTIINKSMINLPGVRHEHFEPGADGFMASEPALFLANISRISQEQPLAAQTSGLRRGQVRSFFAR